MAAQAVLEVQRRRKCELEAQAKAAELAKTVKPRMDLPGLEQRLEKTLLDKAFRPRMGR